MKMEKPEIAFVGIDLDTIVAASDTCTNCALTSGSYRGGGQTCFGDDSVSTECDSADYRILG